MRLFPRGILVTTFTLGALGSITGAQRGGGPPVVTSTQQAPAPTTGSSAISGVVVDGTTQKPLSGAIVQIIGVSALPPGPGQPSRATRLITDERGRFVFTDLPANAGYALTATKFGYFDGAWGRTGPAGAGNTARRIALVDGQWFRDARIELVRPSALNGSVIDEAGEPVVGILVRVYAEIFVSGTRHVASGLATTTDDRGKYRVANLQPGRYLVSVPSVQNAVPAGLSAFELSGTTPDAVAAAEAQGRESSLRRDPAFAPGNDAANRLIVSSNTPTPPPTTAGQPQVYPTIFYPSARTLTDATAINLDAGEDRLAVDVQLRPVPAFRVSGHLEGPAEAIGGLTVRLMTPGSEALGRGSEAATALVTGDGGFTFLNVPNGAYTILASRVVSEYSYRMSLAPSASLPLAPGSRFSSVTNTAVASGPTGTMFTRNQMTGSPRYQGRQAVTVGGRDLTGVVVTLEAGATMTGRYVYEFTNSATPPPRVLLLGAEPANGDPSLGSVRAPSGGPNQPNTEFTLEGLAPGQYLLRVTAGGQVKSITWEGRDYTNTPFDVAAGRDISGVVVTFTDQTNTLTGVIRDRSGQPAASAAAIIFPAEQAQWTNFGAQPTRLRAAAGSTSGAFTLRALPAGDYFIVAVDGASTDRWKDPAFLEAASRVATRVSMAWGDTKTQDLILQEVR